MKQHETNMMIKLPIPQIILIPTEKRQRRNEVSSNRIVEERNTRTIQEDIPSESETKKVEQPKQKGDDNTGNEIIELTGGIKESYEMRFPTEKCIYRLRKRRRLVTYVESVCSDDTKTSIDSDFDT